MSNGLKMPGWFRRFWEKLKDAKNNNATRLLILGGADLDILQKAPSDRGEFRGRGIAAIVPAILAVAGFTIGIDIAIKSLPVAIVIGIIWGGIVLFLDVSLLTSLAGAGWVRKIFMALFRGVISLAAALAISSFMLLAIFAHDISPQMDADQRQAAQQNFVQVIEPRYAADKATAQATLTRDQAAIDAANGTVTTDMQKAQKAELALKCETQGASSVVGCPPGTGHIGYGPAAAVRQTELTAANASLTQDTAAAAAIQKRLTPEMTAAQATLTNTSQSAAADKQAAFGRFLADNGLIPQWKALAELRAESPSVNFWAWVIEILLATADMIAVIAAVFSRTPAYKSVLRGMEAVTKSQADEMEAEARSALARKEAELDALAAAEEAAAEHEANINKARYGSALEQHEWQLTVASNSDRMAAQRADADLEQLENELRAKSARATKEAEIAEAALERQRVEDKAQMDRLQATLRVEAAQATSEAERAEANLDQQREEIKSEEEFRRNIPSTP